MENNEVLSHTLNHSQDYEKMKAIIDKIYPKLKKIRRICKKFNNNI